MEKRFCEKSDFIKSIFDQRKITLCLRGIQVEARWSSLGRLPNSRLGKIRFAKDLNEIKNLCDGFDSGRNEIYFNKSYGAFDTIFDFYNHEKIHLKKKECVTQLYNDMCYWQIREVDISICCYLKYDTMKNEAIEAKAEIEKIANIKRVSKAYSVCCLDSRKTLWLLMEHPESSLLARVISIISIIFVITSIFSIAISTMHILKTKDQFTNTLKEHPIFQKIEIICTIAFTLELFLRILATPDKIAFFKSVLNIVDVISIIPLYFTSLLSISFPKVIIDEIFVLSIFKVFRIFRIFKLIRHSETIRIFIVTIKKSASYLIKMLTATSVFVLFFAIPIYYFEKDEPNTLFTSIPQSIWYCFVSITSIGYGDMVPQTIPGRLSGAFCCFSGIMSISCMIPLISRKFDTLYNKFKRKDKIIEFLDYGPTEVRNY